MTWKPVKDKSKYGVAINNFTLEAEYTIQLTVGNTVHILEELGDWYFGYVLPNRAVGGIFPKSFIHIKDCIVDRTGQFEVVTPRIPPVIQELTAALREWGLLIRNLYIARSPEFKKVYDTMNELISDRKRTLSGQLLVDEMKQIKHEITDHIDLVNRLLGLDLVVRDEQGNILNPDITSTIKLFRHHLEASEKLNRNEELRPQLASGSQQQKPHNAWTIMLSIKNIILKVPDTCDVSLALYMWDPFEGKDSRDGKEGREKLLTEPYIFTWTPGGYNTNTDLYSNLVAFFTDLSSKILMQDKQIYLMGTVVREGSMATKESDRRTSVSSKKSPETDSIRRPFGLFIMEISEQIKKQRETSLQNNILNVPATEIKVPFYSCGERESIESTLRKFMTTRNEFLKENSSSLGIWINLSLFNGDIKKLRKENPHYLPFRELPISYPLCMSDIVVPGDVRNDLYVTLVAGDFSKMRNVEVTVQVCNENGTPIPGVISIGCGRTPVNQYRSVTYPSEPRWMETFKVALPIEEFKKAHLKFLFKRRYSNEVKDKCEKPFGLSFVNLIQPNGTTLLNMDHELLIYKIDTKKWIESDSNYLRLPCVKQPGEEIQKKKEDAYSLSSKDLLHISTVFCSTKLTQKAELLSLLEWGGSGSCSKTDLRRHLAGLRNVPPEELIVFLQDTLDVLFKILMNSSKDAESDNLVFEALVDVIYIAGELNKHESYQSVLDTYIQENFHATLAYCKLITILRSYIDDVCSFPQITKTGTLNKAMKCLHYMIKFIIFSRKLFYELYAQGQQTFQESLTGLLTSIAKLMSCTSDSLLPVQGLCLKYLATTIPDIMSEFDSVSLCYLLIDIVNSLKDQRLSPQRLTAMCEISHSQLFLEAECRSILLEAFIAHIKKLFAENEEQLLYYVMGELDISQCDGKIRKLSYTYLGNNSLKREGGQGVCNVTDSEVAMRKEKTKGKLKDLLGTDTVSPNNSDAKKTEELKLSVKILCDILDIIYGSDDDTTLMTLIQELLQDILAIVAKMRRDDSMLLEFVAVLIALLRQTPERKLLAYFEVFDIQELTQYLSDLLMVMKDLIENPVFSSDWCEMIFLQNYVFMKMLQLISQVVVERMKEPFVHVIWNNLFLTSVKFVTQPSLQLEKFTPSKRSKIIRRYKDLRREMAKIVKHLWLSLGEHKIRFIVRTGYGYSLVAPFLEMTMLPDVEVRRSTIPIFFDMMQVEFFSTRERVSSSHLDTPKSSERIKGKFDEFERDMLEHLDHLIAGGCGDDHYREVFVQLMKSRCKENSIMYRQGLIFIETIGTLMEKLLQYRTIMNAPDHSPAIRMSCTVSLLDFYDEINRKELYLRYVYKLFDLHCECDNFTEAGYTLQLHANLLSWKHEIIPYPLRSSRYANLQYHDELKEKLYYDIIHNYEKGKMWEAALKICKEIVQRYEEVTMEYDKLAKLLSEMAKFYENIMNPQIIRPEPEYFRVAYYGRGFPAFLQNKVFVYRGNGFERLEDFQSRILDPFPNAEVMKTLSPPTREEMESAQQHIQINKVNCVVDESAGFMSMHLAERIRQYYQVNHVDTFSYSRPFHRGQKDPGNEFATLWTEKTILKTMYKLPGVLRCFPVTRETKIEMTPLDNAIATMTSNNLEIESLIRKFVKNSGLNLEPLTRKMSGMVDPAVMGGIRNYEKAFLTEDYLKNNPDDSHKIWELKDLISKQVPLLEMGLEVHGCCVGVAMADLHSHLADCFKKFKPLIQKNYGVSTKPSDLEREVEQFKRLTCQDTGSARSSHYSMGTDSGFSAGLSLPRLTLATSKGNNATLPRGIRLSSSSSSNIRKYFRDSFNVKKEPTTKWFENTFADEASIQASPVEVRAKRTSEKAGKDLYFSRPNSFNPSINSGSSVASLERLSTEVENALNMMASEPASPAVRQDSPPPLPAKVRNLDPERFSLSPSNVSQQNHSNVNGTDDETPPEKPPRPDLSKTVNGEQ